MRNQPLNIALVTLLAAGLAGGCGGADGKGGGSSSGGGAALGAVVIGIAALLVKPLLERAYTDKTTSETALQAQSFRFGRPSEAVSTGTISFVALTRSTPSDHRNREFCRRFLEASQGARNAMASSPEPVAKNVTLWTLSERNSGVADRTDCRYLTDNHDYPHSLALVAAARRTPSEGPYLIARLVSHERPTANPDARPLLIWDLSPIAPEDFHLTLRAWAMMTSLTAEEMKKALAEASFSQTVESIAGIAASRSYRADDLKIALHDE